MEEVQQLSTSAACCDVPFQVYSAVFLFVHLLERSANLLSLAVSTVAYKQLIWERIRTPFFDIVPF